MTIEHSRVDLAGIIVDLMDEPEAIGAITTRAVQPAAIDRLLRTDHVYEPPLAVISANLDHIIQFGHDGRWRRTLGDSLRPTYPDVGGEPARLDWLTLLDGAPLVAQSTRLTRRPWPRLAGSDLIGPLLDAAEAHGISVGFLGGSYLVQRLLSRRLIRTRPGLVVAGMWSPDRSDLADEEASARLASVIAEAGPQLLIVGLGKPRQELWISKYGPATGANVLLAFGAVVDFLADAIQRAPQIASESGLEWAWRLAREPRRLAKRYLLDDPPGLVKMRRHSVLIDHTTATSGDQSDTPAPRPTKSSRDSTVEHRALTVHTASISGTFASPGRPADVAVVIVTYNNEKDIRGLLATLRQEADGLRIRVVVADNDSTDATVEILREFQDVVTVPTGGNLGYAAGINVAQRWVGDVEAVLVLNPDLRVAPGAISSLLEAIRSGTADVVVPRILDGTGKLTRSLRREPSIGTVFGDALLGERWPQRPGFLAETDAAPESYQFGHEIDWATGAAVMTRADVARRIGEWDERFFLYSEETDYFRRARELGAVVRYEPRAQVNHAGSGSGSSTRQDALMAVNRIRYVRKHHSELTAAVYRAGVVLNDALRVHRKDRRQILRVVTDEATWDALPGPSATSLPAHVLSEFPQGTVIIPAHNESAVIVRTLSALEPILRTGHVDVIVACNGCTDNTAELAASIPGVQVIETRTPSKTAAMNAADDYAAQWPRIYLDADIEISPTALRRLLEQLRDPILAARPSFRYDDSSASGLVKAYYRARRRLPSTSEALWGAGVFGLTEAGHARFGAFPDVTADDFFVDRQFSEEEKLLVPTPPVVIRVPQDVRSLVRVLHRSQRGPSELRKVARLEMDRSDDVAMGGPGTRIPADSSTSSTAWELMRSVRGPRSAADALSYTGLSVAPRLTISRTARAPRRMIWERDESSRVPLQAEEARP